MRHLLVAALALTPVLVHAQAQSPAQPRGQVLESRLVSPAAVNGTSSPNVARPTSVLLAPKLVKWSNIPQDDARVQSGTERSVTVSMLVTEKGEPTNLKIVASDDPLLDQNVLAAVARYHFVPATLDSRAVPAPLVLKIHVLRHSN